MSRTFFTQHTGKDSFDIVVRHVVTDLLVVVIISILDVLQAEKDKGDVEKEKGALEASYVFTRS